MKHIKIRKLLPSRIHRKIRVLIPWIPQFDMYFQCRKVILLKLLPPEIVYLRMDRAATATVCLTPRIALPSAKIFSTGATPE